MLGKLSAGTGYNAQVGVKEQGGDTSGARVDGQDVSLLHIPMLGGWDSQRKHPLGDLKP
jgi:hypothetical protein